MVPLPEPEAPLPLPDPEPPPDCAIADVARPIVIAVTAITFRSIGYPPRCFIADRQQTKASRDCFGSEAYRNVPASRTASVADRKVRGNAFILDSEVDENIIGTSARRQVKIGLKALKEIEVVRPQAAEKLAEETLREEVDAVVAFHQGDVRAAITTLLLDCHHLRLQLALRDKDVSRAIACERTTRFEGP
ncbi:hypothetical protein PYR71_15330 [Rhizobium sp. MC63]|uniref:Uncharacterized protein n=1 Tax=Rhizobium mulingense TaxID=3031128 RepID=A0ACC6N4G1_9HYPH|nr:MULTISPECIES: hypothetical protein [unclassified Rhizobium]MDF0697853.1 hypothetical protein [Rhizobium sp. MC63]MEA3520555.1 hypothetical protein [Rhizobium sp. MJ31]MEB3043737.1 hypothetical protein [Rhizobium sp. MJ21]